MAKSSERTEGARPVRAGDRVEEHLGRLGGVDGGGIDVAAVLGAAGAPDEVGTAVGSRSVTAPGRLTKPPWAGAADGTVGSCVGVYAFDGPRAAFRWTGGCTGDWAMTYSLEGDHIVWSDVELLEPDAGVEEQRVAEVFNGVPWTRTSDVPEDG